MDKFNPEELDFQPFESSWTVRRIALNIANTEDGWLRYVAQRETNDWPEWSEGEAAADVESIKTFLDDVHARTMDFLGALDIEEMARVVEAPLGERMSLGWIVWHVLEHEIHHRGELSLTLGMLGNEGLDL